MKPVSRIQIILFAAVAVAFALFPFTPAPAAAVELQSSITRGGRLYDNWYAEINERPPTLAHPAYPRDRAYSGDAKTNWRCKECHGWDYRGRDGAFSTGPHATGIKGIDGMAGADPQRIVAILKDATHAYDGLMADENFRDLANFVSKGQIDMDRYIDRATKMAKGHESRRQDHYKSICAGCHGRDGHRLRTIPPLGDVARGNPWESLHKILNGHPAEKMPALRVLDRETLTDILAYVQTLPDGEVISSMVRGGRLYDDWRKEIGGFPFFNSRPDYPPNSRHPAYPIDKAFAKDPRTNWRCKECHGWDYLGSAGAYGTSRHFTGIKGIRGMAGADPATVIAILKDENHGYGEVLAFQELRDLSNFVTKGQADMDAYIDRTSKLAKGYKTKRIAHFTTICATCHGRDGTMMLTARPLGWTARHNPWEVLHKMINGHPDEAMPALRVVGMDTLAGILAYVQTLHAE